MKKNELSQYGNINNILKINTKTNKIYYEDNTVFFYKNDDLAKLKKPIDYLLTIYSEKPFWINKIDYNFYYEIDDNFEVKKLSYTDSNKKYIDHNIDIIFNKNTKYINQEVVLNDTGIFGFYIPDNAIGYCETIINVEINNFTKTFFFTFNYNFEHQKFIQLNPIKIVNLDGYKKLIYE